MRTMITQHGANYFWSVIPPICAQSGTNFGKVKTYQAAEAAVKQYCSKAVTEVFDDVFNDQRQAPRFIPTHNDEIVCASRT